MGTIFRTLCGLFVLMLVGAACASGPQKILKDPASTANGMLVITVDPKTGSVVSVKDDSGNTLQPADPGQTKVGTLATSTTPITITVELKPAIAQLSQASSASGGTTSGQARAVAGTCRIFYVNGVQYCR